MRAKKRNKITFTSAFFDYVFCLSLFVILSQHNFLHIITVVVHVMIFSYAISSPSVPVAALPSEVLLQSLVLFSIKTKT